jgi:hypothetical protein
MRERPAGVVRRPEYKSSIDPAFARLGKHANDRNATLRAVADAVGHPGPRPDRHGTP